MTLKIYKTKEDQVNKTPIIFNNVLKVVDQTNDNEIDIFIESKNNLARWENIPNRNDYFLIVIEQ